MDIGNIILKFILYVFKICLMVCYLEKYFYKNICEGK